MFLIIAMVLAFAGSAIVTPLIAQECGSFSEAATHLIEHRPVFADAEWGDERAALGITAIDPSEPVEIVTDAATCASLISDMRGELTLPADPTPDWYAIYRYGPYYAIELLPPGQVGNVRYHGYERLRIYTVGQGQKFKGTIRVSQGT